MKRGQRLTPEEIAQRSGPRQPEGPRFWSKVDQSGGPDACWPWTRACGADGYGRFWFRGAALNAHRVAMILTLGEVPADRDVDHFRCKDRRCCNPAHLRLATELQNALENNESPFARNARRTHCGKGHPFSGANVIQGKGKGKNGKPTRMRICVACYLARRPAAKTILGHPIQRSPA